jgi:hypothetical protein
MAGGALENWFKWEDHRTAAIVARGGETVAAQAVIIFEMPDHRFDGSATLELALDLRGDATLSGPAVWTLNRCPGWGVVAR